MKCKKDNKIQGCTIVLLNFILFGAFAQEPDYHQYTPENGLPSSQVYDFIQDDWGYMWFSTDHGLCRYDGYTFDYYTEKDGLTNNVVFNFLKDPTGAIWCTSYGNTLVKFEGEIPKFTSYEYNQKLSDAAGSRFVVSEHIMDHKGNHYFKFAYLHGYLMITPAGETYNCLEEFKSLGRPILDFNPVAFLSFSIDTVSGSSFVYSEDSVNPMEHFPDGFSSMSLRVRSGLSKIYGVYFQHADRGFVIHHKEWIQLDGGVESSRMTFDDEMNRIGKVDESHFWVSTFGNGLKIFDINGRETHSLLKGKFTTMLYVDHEEGMWVSTLYSGIYHFKNLEVKKYDIPSEIESISDLVGDNNNALWIGCYNGRVFKKQNHRTIEIKTPIKYERPVQLLYDDVTNKVYYHTDRHVYDGNTNDSTLVSRATLSFHFFHESQEDSGILYTSQVDGFGYYGLENNWFSAVARGERIEDMVFFNDKFHLAGRSGLFIENGGEFELVDSNETILSARFDDISVFSNSVVMASMGYGVVIYDGNSTQKISRSEGLISNFVSRIYVENDSTIWACTNVGLNRIRFESDQTYEIDKITRKDGLISGEVTCMTVIGDTIWVGTMEGICCFHKKIIESVPKSFDYHFSINKMLVNDDPVDFEKNIDLSYDQNLLEFHFSGVSFNESKKLTYRYKLIGVEDDWTYTEDRNVVYRALAPGDYKFMVQVKGENASWKDQAQTIEIEISPPFWQTWWFRSIVVLLVSILIYLFFYFRILTYNRDIVREILRHILKRLRNETLYIVVRESGKEVKIATKDILFVKSDGNYLEIHTERSKHVIREKMNNFLRLVPDPLEFLRVRRSYIVRIDKVSEKGKRHIVVNDYRIEVGQTYLKELSRIQL